jgi:hypothetical protein
MDFKKRVWGGFIWLRMGTMAGPCKPGKKSTDFIKAWQFLEQLSVVRLVTGLITTSELDKKHMLLFI